MDGISTPSEPLIEKQLSEEPNKPVQITTGTFLDNGSPILGDSNAPITLVEFGDYQCHFCNVYYHNTEHKIYEDYVVTGKSKDYFQRLYNNWSRFYKSCTWQHIVLHEQGKFWQYHNTLYEQLGRRE